MIVSKEGTLMDYNEDEIIYHLDKKGKDKLSDFDKLLIESNPPIKEKMQKISEDDLEFYEAVNKRTEAKTALRKKVSQRKISFFTRFSMPAAASFLLIFLFTYIYYNNFTQESLGGSVSIYVSPADAPDSFYPPNGSFTGGEEVSLAFLPSSELTEEVSRGILFSIDSSLESTVYYRYDKSSGPLNTTSRTRLDRTIRLPRDREGIYFVIILSGTDFDEQEQINIVKEMIQKKQLKDKKSLERKMKNKAASFIYLKK